MEWLIQPRRSSIGHCVGGAMETKTAVVAADNSMVLVSWSRWCVWQWCGAEKRPIVSDGISAVTAGWLLLLRFPSQLLLPSLSLLAPLWYKLAQPPVLLLASACYCQFACCSRLVYINTLCQSTSPHHSRWESSLFHTICSSNTLYHLLYPWNE